MWRVKKINKFWLMELWTNTNMFWLHFSGSVMPSIKSLDYQVLHSEMIQLQLLLNDLCLYQTEILKKVWLLLADPSHPLHEEFRLLPSGCRYSQVTWRTNRLRNSFVLIATGLLKHALQHLSYFCRDIVCVLFYVWDCWLYNKLSLGGKQSFLWLWLSSCSCGFHIQNHYLASSTWNLSPVQVKFSMYPPALQLIRSQTGLQTARKFGRRRPMEYLAMSVRDWLAAAPNT